MEAAVLRECGAARGGVAVMDATTLGKIDVIGPDAGEFLNRVYTNAFAKLAVNSARYGVMCRADGMVFDDGVSRARPTTATTYHHHRRCRPCWTGSRNGTRPSGPSYASGSTSVTEQWATIAVVGPRFAAVVGGLARSSTSRTRPSPSWRSVRTGRTGFRRGSPASASPVSWPTRSTWRRPPRPRALAGRDGGGEVTPYGTETMHVLRAEKGYPIVGQDTDGTVTPHDLGMAWIVLRRSRDFVGRRSFSPADGARPNRRPWWVSSRSARRAPAPRARSWSPTLTAAVRSRCSATSPRAIAAPPSVGRSPWRWSRAAASGSARPSRAAPGRTIAVEVADAVLYDPEGARRDGRPG